MARGRLRCLGPGEILRGRLRFSRVSDSQSLSPSPTDFTTVIVTSIKHNSGGYSHSDLSGITAREPQQNPVLVFSITLTQKRVRPPVWIILVLHAELASVRALQGLSKALITPTSQTPIYSRTCVRCIRSCSARRRLHLARRPNLACTHKLAAGAATQRTRSPPRLLLHRRRALCIFCTRR